MAIETAHVPARTSTGLTAYQGAGRAGTYKITSTPVIVRTGAADCYPARTIPAHKRIGTVVVVAAHTPARAGTGLTAHQGTGRASTYQSTSTPVIIRAGSPGCYPAHPGAAYQRVGTVVIVPAHTSARTAPGLTAHQGTRRAGAYKSTSTPVIVRAGAADCYPARTIPAYQRAGTVVVVPAHTPGRPGPGLSAYLTTRCPGAYQRVGTLAIGTARITVRPARAYPGPAGQITGTIAIGTTTPPAGVPHAPAPQINVSVQ